MSFSFPTEPIPWAKLQITITQISKKIQSPCGAGAGGGWSLSFGIWFVICILLFVIYFERKREVEGGAFVWKGFGPNAAAVALHDSLYDGQSKTGAFNSGVFMQSAEWLEQHLFILLVEADAVIPHGVCNKTVLHNTSD